MESTGNSSVSGDRKASKKTVASSVTAKPNGKSHVSSTNPMNPNTVTALSSAHANQVMFFRDVSLGPREAELRFRLIHLWEARNIYTKTLIGQEMLLIDEEGTVIQAGSVYKLRNFFGSRNKAQFSVADHIAIVSFSWNSDLSVLENPPVLIPEDRFRFHSFEEFMATCDSKDYVGHMRLVNGQTLTDHIVLDEVAIAEKRHLCVHVQTHDGPVMKLYLWDNAASEFCQKFKSYGRIPHVLLVTTVNPKHLGVLINMNPFKDYFELLVSNTGIANRIAAEVVTKPETVTLEELFSYIKQEASKVAWFECTATIDDVVQGSSWYYVSCGGCNSKAVKGPTSLMCSNKKCEKSEVTGVPQYLTKISVYDKSEQAVFVILGNAGKELTGKHAAELVANFFESNEGAGTDHCVPVLGALLDTIGQTRKFIGKVSDHNLKGKTQTITVTKILPLEAPLPATSDDIPTTMGDGSAPSSGFGDAAGDRARKAADNLESDDAKRSKSG
ncbi:BnaC03g59860D [Brassica napus]|uniref:BnaC03g59860D protein n=1 Tax=Brassica napus TaxID=3708 RepID=A0A078FCI2_BRANA|nr:BnaC03g59860D [Brassica napus]